MEPRHQPRFEIDQEVTVTLLGDAPIDLPARIANFSGKGLCLLSGQELSPGKALKIELADTLVLGEVVYCRDRGAGYQVGIELEQAIYHTRDLATLAARLLLDRKLRPRPYDSEVTPL